MSWRYYEYYEPTTPIETDEGIKARSKRGDFVKNWWSKRWIEALEKISDKNRLTRGRRYARKGQVLSLDESGFGIKAQVQGSRSKPYKVDISLEPFTARQWEKVINTLSERAIFTAQLLSGEMPQDIEEAFSAAGVSLFPDKRGGLETDCSCPDYSNPCKHVAAVHYILGEQFDEDPFLIFRLRGKSQEQIVEALNERNQAASEELVLAEERADYITAEPAVPLEETLDHFWDLGAPIEQFATAIREPQTRLSVLRRLGQPAFMDETLSLILGPVYDGASEVGLKVAFATAEGNDRKGNEGKDLNQRDIVQNPRQTNPSAQSPAP